MFESGRHMWLPGECRGNRSSLDCFHARSFSEKMNPCQEKRIDGSDPRNRLGPAKLPDQYRSTAKEMAALGSTACPSGKSEPALHRLNREIKSAGRFDAPLYFMKTHSFLQPSR